MLQENVLKGSKSEFWTHFLTFLKKIRWMQIRQSKNVD